MMKTKNLCLLITAALKVCYLIKVLLDVPGQILLTDLYRILQEDQCQILQEDQCQILQEDQCQILQEDQGQTPPEGQYLIQEDLDPIHKLDQGQIHLTDLDRILLGGRDQIHQKAENLRIQVIGPETLNPVHLVVILVDLDQGLQNHQRRRYLIVKWILIVIVITKIIVTQIKKVLHPQHLLKVVLR
uniref:Putative product n=1 Tax=Xenopsylla cheopis TaxID=163159 RepID=A0A6M2DZJ7_XENCH